MSNAVYLYLIRHPNTFEATDTPVMVGSQSDLPLTQKGLKQAQALAQYFNDRSISVDAIYSGNLCRQTKTADTIINTYPHLILKKIDALEEINYGPWEKQTPELVSTKWTESYKQWTEQGQWPVDVFDESYEHRITLLKEWLELLSTTHKGQTVLAVTSQGVIKLLLTLFPSLWHKNEGDTLLPFKVQTGRFCQLELNDEVLIKLWNQEPVALNESEV